MRGNDQKYVPDPRARSPGLNPFGGMPSDYQTNNQTYAPSERRTFHSPDYGMLNTGGGMYYQGSSNLNQNLYDRENKQPASYNPPTPHQYPMPDYRSNFDPNSMFVPQSKYLQEEMKKNNFGNNYNYTMPNSNKPAQMSQNYQSMGMPQPQQYDMKLEPNR